MSENFEDLAQQYGQPNKKVKLNEDKAEEIQEKGDWIIVKKKEPALTISIADFSKINRYYSHKSIQNYLRYLLVQTCPNPMWLSIKRQSLIEHIIYIDMQIENNLFEEMIENKKLEFLSQNTNIRNKAIFKNSKFVRENLWECLLSYENQEQIIEEFNQSKRVEMDSDLYNKYKKYTLTSQQMKQNLYPDKSLELYSNYFEIIPTQDISVDLKNLILIIDCEMIITKEGFELARATIVNYNGQIIYDAFFKPKNEILNYNTEYSGITKQILDPITNTIQNDLHPFLQKTITNKTILIGHSLQNDFNAMKFIHPNVIDTSVLYMRKNGTKLKLKHLSDKILKKKIQVQTHDSIEDCLATLGLVQYKIQNDDHLRKVKFNLLEEMVANKISGLIVDYALDHQIRENNAIHFEKVNQQENPETILKILEKYLRKDIKIPQLILTRIQKINQIQWDTHYLNFDAFLANLFEKMPPYTTLFINCQINDSVRIVSSTLKLKPQQNSRPFCVFLTK